MYVKPISQPINDESPFSVARWFFQQAGMKTVKISTISVPFTDVFT